MTRDPFKIDVPTSLNVSGGRTSGYMLWRALQSNGGLPPDAMVNFANTGKEDEATLRFVRDMQEKWNVPITWLEFTPEPPYYKIVNFDTAARNGEPFESLIRKRNYLPNQLTRFCTTELKIKCIHRHMLDAGLTEWDQFVGIRADEPRRIAKMRVSSTTHETMCMPLAEAGVTTGEVLAFWKAQDFDLALPTYNGRTFGGNCDLCFLKGKHELVRLIAEKPSRATWWIKQEEWKGARFRKMEPHGYADLLKAAGDVSYNPLDLEDAIECFCGD